MQNSQYQMLDETSGRWYGFKDACKYKIYYAPNGAEKKKCTDAVWNKAF